MKLLFIDIETSPNVADVWELWNQNISLSQLREASRLMCFAAKWWDQDEVLWFHEEDDDMLRYAHSLLNEADIVCHYNGRKFDIPTLNKEFLLAGMKPPAPYQQLDLLQVVRQRFRFPSNKLEYVADVLELSGKKKHSGHALWTRCMFGSKDAWEEMEEYNKQDVRVLEELYFELLPWITNHPVVALFGDEPEVPSCPYCDETILRKQGFAYTRTGKYQRYRCNSCGGWSQDNKRIVGSGLRGVI